MFFFCFIVFAKIKKKTEYLMFFIWCFYCFPHPKQKRSVDPHSCEKLKKNSSTTSTLFQNVRQTRTDIVKSCEISIFAGFCFFVSPLFHLNRLWFPAKHKALTVFVNFYHFGELLNFTPLTLPSPSYFLTRLNRDITKSRVTLSFP